MIKTLWSVTSGLKSLEYILFGFHFSGLCPNLLTEYLREFLKTFYYSFINHSILLQSLMIYIMKAGSGCWSVRSDMKQCQKYGYTYTFTHFWMPGMKRQVQKGTSGVCVCSVEEGRTTGDVAAYHWGDAWQKQMLPRDIPLCWSVPSTHPIHTHTPDKDHGRKKGTERCSTLLS